MAGFFLHLLSGIWNDHDLGGGGAEDEKGRKRGLKRNMEIEFPRGSERGN